MVVENLFIQKINSQKKVLKMKINMVPKVLLDSEKTKLYERITRLIGEKLSYLISDEGGWKAREIYSHVGIPEARQSEYKDFDKYKRKISRRDLIMCLGGGIVTVEELIGKCATNEKEKEYLGTLELYENQELRDAIKETKLKGYDPVEILKLYGNQELRDIIKKIELKGLDPVEILKKELNRQK